MSAPQVFPADPAPALHAFADGVWTSTDDLRFFGARLTHRMVVLEDASRSHWLISPCESSEPLIAAIRELGPISGIVANSTLHDTYLQDWQATMPAVPLVTVPGMPSPVRSDREVAMDRVSELAPGIVVIPIQGLRTIREIAVFHEATKTLVVADMIFHYPSAEGWWTKIFFWLGDIGPTPEPDRLYRSLIRDKAAFAETVTTIEALAPTTIIPCHGVPLRDNVPEVLARIRQRFRPS